MLIIYLDMLTRKFSRALTSSECPTEPFSRRWHFIALTYDPTADKAYARCNDFQVALNPGSESSSPTGSFKFGSPDKFLIDEVFYVSKFSTEHALTTIQNMSKFILAIS